MKWLKRVGVVLLILVVLIAGGGWAWLQWSLKASLPRTDGEIRVAGLGEPVEIVRDTYGVPHIYARNEPDLYFGFGYAMAQDRFWQMEFMRRLGRGRLSEIFGSDLVKADRYFRTLTAGGLNKTQPPEQVPLLRAFTQGVNAYLQTHADRLPFEFTLLRHRPEPWDPEDHLAVLTVMNWSLSSGLSADLTAAEVLEKVGPEMLRDAFPEWAADAPLIMADAEDALRRAAAFSREALHLVRHFLPTAGAAASNNWVVAGRKSASGKPILANDTHLGLSNPSMWWEVHLVCPTINAAGFAIPGIPGIAIGHNADTAWGITNVMVDDADFYVEKINPQNPHESWYLDRWESMRIVKETIRVKGGDPVEAEIRLTRHGPILQGAGEAGEERAVSLRWAFTEGLQPVQAGYELLKAGDVSAVTEALRHWELPSQNFVFADRQGNIGFWTCATIPIRPGKDGLLPLPGWTGENEWQGYVPFDERPHLINPAAGYLATANGRVAGEDYPHYISLYWEPEDRISRIRQLLEAKEKVGVEDIQAMHQDIHCLLAAELTPLMVQVLESRLTDEPARRARELLSRWDHRMTQESAAASLFEVTLRTLMEEVFQDEMGPELFAKYLETTTFPARAVRHLIRAKDSRWFDDVRTTEKETMEDILARSLGRALAELKQRLGEDVAKWRWDRIHTLTFEHALGKKKPLDRLFNLGPYPVPGNHLTVNKKQYDYVKPYHANHGVSMRMIVDFSNPAGALHVLPTGESGHRKSLHHQDQVPLYLEGRYHPAWTDRGELEANRTATLVLKP